VDDEEAREIVLASKAHSLHGGGTMTVRYYRVGTAAYELADVIGRLAGCSGG
jgi:hypothetical protein